MSETPVQSYEHHVRHDRMIYTVLLLQVVGFIVVVIALILDSTRVLGSALLISIFAGMLTAMMARGYGVKLQDRIIRTEMRLRLHELLPDDLKSRIPEFTIPQLIALRFASDQELPELAQKVLDENIEKARDIKKQIKDWQADLHRV